MIVVCSSSIYGFWLPLWYLQTLIKLYFHKNFFFLQIFSKWLSLIKANLTGLVLGRPFQNDVWWPRHRTYRIVTIIEKKNMEILYRTNKTTFPPPNEPNLNTCFIFSRVAIFFLNYADSNFCKYPGRQLNLLLSGKVPSNHTFLEPAEQQLWHGAI
jgi:hypothetical protein